MLSKLYDIKHNSHKKVSKKLKPIKMTPDRNVNYFSKTKYSSGKSLINSISLTNENRNLHKRIIQKSSIYSISKWDEQYKKSREYKKNLCQYPSIDFCTITPNSKSLNKLDKSKDNNVFSDIRFKPFVFFEKIYKKNKNNNRNINTTDNKEKNSFNLYDDEKIKRQKEKKKNKKKEKKKKKLKEKKKKKKRGEKKKKKKEKVKKKKKG
jgi:hypothetical protein